MHTKIIKEIDGERCRKCKKLYSIIYRVSDKLWEKLTGSTNGSGLYCLTCIDEMARDKGIYLYWEPGEGNWKN